MAIVRKIKTHFHSFHDILLFVQIFSFITLLPLIVKYMTVPGMMKMLTPKNGNEKIKINSDHQQVKIEKYTDYILSMNFWMYKVICLKRSLVLYHFLRKFYIDVHVCFGVRFEKAMMPGMAVKEIEGHAWLLYKGQVFLERYPEETGTYTMTYCYPDNS